MHIYVDMHTVCTGRIFEIYIFVSITRTLATNLGTAVFTIGLAVAHK